MFRWIWLEIKYRRASVYGESCNFSYLASSVMLIQKCKRASQTVARKSVGHKIALFFSF